MQNTPPSRIQPIAANPQILSMNMTLIIGMFLLIVILALLGTFPFSWSTNLIQKQPLYYTWLLIGAGLFVVLLLGRVYVRLRMLKRIERRRTAITLEKRYRTAVMDEPLSYSALPLIPSIVLLLKRSFIWFWTIIVLGFVIVSTVNLVLMPTNSTHFTVFLLIYVILLIGVFEVVPGIIILILLFRTQRTVQAMDNGLKAERGKFIPWQEAHIFAHYTLPSLLPGGKILYYELSGSSQIITWILVSNSRSPFVMWKPQLSIDEYHRHMQTLHNLITEKTGLPLINLDQPLNSQRPEDQ